MGKGDTAIHNRQLPVPGGLCCVTQDSQSKKSNQDKERETGRLCNGTETYRSEFESTAWGIIAGMFYVLSVVVINE